MRFFIDISDRRNFTLKKLLSSSGFIAKPYDDNFIDYRDGDILVFSPAKKFLPLDIEILPKNTTIFAGSSLLAFNQELKNKKIKYVNIMDNEIFTIKNANLTAEGVLGILIEKSEKSLFKNNVLLLGSGRITKACAILFSKLGVSFAIASYTFEDYQKCHTFTDKCYFKDAYIDDLEKYDVVINTRPAQFIDDATLNKFKKDCLFIETASVNCLNKDSVKTFEYVLAPALPTRFTPETAGEVLYERIMEEIDG